ncbi:DUF7159 family protein [Mycobacterium sp.]|uniref:DUF7159 family protein n=1 Tax=Mycobacterium sp. TaxID=1785 RepID=UPI002D83E0D2|nr:hypothetical protein [Mycobacterium sp.]
MDTVLGVSITSTGVGWVLVEGSAADGATLDHDAFDVDVSDTSQHAVAVRGAQAIAAATGHEIRSIGVTWTDDVQTEARQLLASLTEAGYDNLVEMRLPQAAKAWAQGIGRDLGFEQTAVCVVEPAAVTVLNVDAVAGAVQIDVTHSRDSASADGLGRWLSEVFAGNRRKPDSLLLVGSRSDRDQLAGPLDEVLPMPVISTSEAQLVLARGAALALLNDAGVADVQAVGEADADEGDDEADEQAPPVRDRPPRMGSWLASHAKLSAIVTVGVVAVAIAIIAVAPRLLTDTQPLKFESPTGTTTPTLATAQAVPPPVPSPAPPRPAAPPQMLAAEPQQAVMPTEVSEPLAVPAPEVEFVEEEPVSTPAAEPLAVVDEQHAPSAAVGLAPGPIAAPPVEPAPAPPPPPAPVGSVLSPIFGALP